MDKNEKINWKAEDNNYLNKILNLINLCLSFVIILAPILTSVVCLTGLKLDVLNVYIIFYLFFILQRIIYISINFRFFKFRKLDILEILALALFAMLIISATITGGVKSTFLFVIGYFLVFLNFTRVDKKYYKALLYTFILTMVVCSIMGICDLHNSYMPGFVENTFPMSLQFYNPNYSGYITVMAILMCIYVLSKYKTVAEQIIFWLSYVVLNVALFINGCFSAETAMFVGELLLLIYLWIKTKKCPYLILSCMIISIGSSFVWIKGVSTSGANYMFESLAVIDGKLKTTLVKDVSTFFDKIFHTGIIDKVPGSNGWDRENLKAKAWAAITSSPKSFIFGNGVGFNFDILVHNVVLHFWLEYGLINVLIYCAILVVIFVRIFKTKFSSHNIYLFTLMVSVVVVCHYFGCIDPYSFTYFVCFLAVFVKDANSGKTNSLQETQEDEINEISDFESRKPEIETENNENLSKLSDSKLNKKELKKNKETAKKQTKTVAKNKGKYYEFNNFGK